jgi:hypothetical protein
MLKATDEISRIRIRKSVVGICGYQRIHNTAWQIKIFFLILLQELELL